MLIVKVEGNLRIVLIALSLALIVSVCALAAGKVTVDPNTPANAAKAVPVDDTDKRLQQKVTIDLGYTRLHYALEEISAKTGVTVRCGASSKDWQTRDLPVDVCAKDIALGKLLRAIADSTHLDLSAETVQTDKGKKEKACRIWFSAKSQAELDNYRAEEREAGVAAQSRAWDVLVDCADLPESAISQYMSSPSDRSAILARQALGRILKDLGAGSKAKILNGQRVDLTLSKYSKPDMFREFYSLAQKDAYHFEIEYARQHPDQSNFKLEPPTDEQMDVAGFTIRSNTDSETGQFYVSTNMQVHNGDNTATSYNESLTSAADKLQNGFRDAKLPELVKTGRRYPSPPDHISKDLVRVSLTPEPGEKPAAILSQKVKLDLPKDRDVIYGDVMAALAKASGLTIVSDDFLSHLHRFCLSWKTGLPLPGETTTTTTHVSADGVHTDTASRTSRNASSGANKTYFSPLGPNPPKEMTVGEVLAMLAWPNHRGMLFDWFVNEKDNLIVGRSLSYDWLRNHQNMMPESLLVYLRNKANGEGVELDDLSKLSGYPSTQCWINDSKDLYFLNCWGGWFWRLYERLSPQDKAKAKSDHGLALANYDTVWIADFVKAQSNSTNMVYGGTLESVRRAKAEDEQRLAAFNDPQVIHGMILRIETRPSTSWTTFTEDSTGSHTSEIPKGIVRHSYYPVVQGESKDGQKFSVELSRLANAFPIYSPKREAELAKKRAKQP